MTFPCIIIERVGCLIRVYLLTSEDDEPGTIIAMDDVVEARATAAIMASCMGWPIIDRSAKDRADG